MESHLPIPRIRGVDLERFTGRDVHILCTAQGAQMLSNNLLRMHTVDGVLVNVFLPPGEHVPDSPFLLFQGKVQDRQSFHAMRLEGIASLDVETYNQAMDLAANKYSYLFLG